MAYDITKDNVVFIEYNGAGRPHQVWIDSKTGFDFFMKGGYITADWSSSGFMPYIHELIDRLKGKRKIWFREEFRPSNGGKRGYKPLSNKQIEKLGYVIIDKPNYLDEVVEAIWNSPSC